MEGRDFEEISLREDTLSIPLINFRSEFNKDIPENFPEESIFKNFNREKKYDSKFRSEEILSDFKNNNRSTREFRESIYQYEEPAREAFGRTLHRFANLYPNINQINVPRQPMILPVLERIGEAVDGLGVIRRAFIDTPPEELDSLLKQMGNDLTGEEGVQKAKLLRALFSSQESSTFSSSLKTEKIDISELPDLFFTDGVFSLLSAMLEKPDKFRMQLGIILSQIDIKKIPDELRDKLKPLMSPYELDIQTENGHWYLCPVSEPRLDESIKEGSALAIVDGGKPIFLIKFRGKMSALCLQNFATQDGKVFVRGNWYSPTDGELRNSLKETFDQGKGQVGLQKGSWTLMRPVKPGGGKTEEQIIYEATEFAGNIPKDHGTDQITIGSETMSRSEFRQKYNKEEG